MILSRLKKYIETRGQATLSELANYSGSSPDAVRGMLEIWIRKGQLTKRRMDPACGTKCQQCDVETTEIYYWKGVPAALTESPGCDRTTRS